MRPGSVGGEPDKAFSQGIHDTRSLQDGSSGDSGRNGFQTPDLRCLEGVKSGLQPIMPSDAPSDSDSTPISCLRHFLAAGSHRFCALGASFIPRTPFRRPAALYRRIGMNSLLRFRPIRPQMQSRRSFLKLRKFRRAVLDPFHGVARLLDLQERHADTLHCAVLPPANATSTNQFGRSPARIVWNYMSTVRNFSITVKFVLSARPVANHQLRDRLGLRREADLRACPVVRL